MNEDSIESFLSITENRSRILAVIVMMVQDFEIAEELFQETVMEILKSEVRFDPSRNFVPWACGIAKNVVRKHWRLQSKPMPDHVGGLIEELAMVGVEEDGESWKQELKALRRCISRLPTRMQNLLLLRYGHNLKGKELADSVPMRLGSLRTTLARLRNDLRLCIRSKIAQN